MNLKELNRLCAYGTREDAERYAAYIMRENPNYAARVQPIRRGSWIVRFVVEWRWVWPLIQ